MEVAVLVEPRLMREDDLPWLQVMFNERYPFRNAAAETEGWFRNIVLKSPLVFNAIRTDHAFLIAMVSLVPWLPNDLECNVICVCAEADAGWQVMRLLRASIGWAKGRGCKTWKLVSDTKHDLAPLARRVGVQEVSPRFELRF